MKSREAAAVVSVVPFVVGVVEAEVGPVVLACGPDVVLDCGTGVVVGTDVDVDVDSSPRETDALSAPPQPTSATLPNAAAKPRITLRFAVNATPEVLLSLAVRRCEDPPRFAQSLAGVSTPTGPGTSAGAASRGRP